MKYIKRLNNTAELNEVLGISQEQIAEIPVFDVNDTVADLANHVNSLPIISPGNYVLSDGAVVGTAFEGEIPFGFIISKSRFLNDLSEISEDSPGFYAFELLMDYTPIIPGEMITPLDFEYDDCVILIMDGEILIPS